MQTLAVRERMLGAEHPDTLDNLADGYLAVGPHQDAERIRRSARRGAM